MVVDEIGRQHRVTISDLAPLITRFGRWRGGGRGREVPLNAPYKMISAAYLLHTPWMSQVFLRLIQMSLINNIKLKLHLSICFRNLEDSHYTTGAFNSALHSLG